MRASATAAVNAVSAAATSAVKKAVKESVLSATNIDAAGEQDAGGDEDEGQVSAEELQECESKLALLEGLVSGDAEDLDDEDEQIEGALDMLQGLLQLTLRMVPADEEKVDVQKLKLPRRTAAETALRRYAWLAKATVDVTSHAISALPFGAPLAAVLQGVYGQAEQVGAKSCQFADSLHRC